MGYETVKDLTAGTVGGIGQVHLETRLVRLRSRHLTVRMLCVSSGPRRATFRYSQSGMCSPKPFNANLFEPNMQRMQTAPAGTYSGMLQCAGGILKNEGPFAFYKASPFQFDFFESSCLTQDFVGVIGNSDTVARDQCVRFDPICRSGVFEAIIFLPEHHFGTW